MKTKNIIENIITNIKNKELRLLLYGILIQTIGEAFILYALFAQFNWYWFIGVSVAFIGRLIKKVYDKRESN